MFVGEHMNAPLVQFSSPGTVHMPTGFSHVVQVNGGRLVYTAGQVAQDASGALVGKDDFRAQVRQVFANLQAVLESADATFANVVKLNYFCCERVPSSDLSIIQEIRD